VAATKDGETKDAERDAQPSLLERYRARYPWLDHLVRAGQRYTERHGDHYAAAVTYFSVLSLVPLILAGIAIAGYVLFFNPDLLRQLQTGISENLPGGLDDFIDPIITSAIDNRGTLGIFALLGALYTGVGWMSSLRQALSEQWGHVPEAPPIAKRLLFDLLALVGLGAALLGSFAITGLTAGATEAVLGFLGFADQVWAQVLLVVLGIVLGLLANWLIFLWVIARLPRQHATLRSAAKAALLGAGRVRDPQADHDVLPRHRHGLAHGRGDRPLVGLLVFVFFVSRFVLFVTAWAATSTENEQEVPAVPGPAVIRSEVTVRSGPDGAMAAGLSGPAPSRACSAGGSCWAVAAAADPAAHRGRCRHTATQPTPIATRPRTRAARASAGVAPGAGGAAGGAAGAGATTGAAAGAVVGGTGGPSTSSPSGATPAGRANPRSSSAATCRVIGTGDCSPRTTATASRRPSRSAAPTKVCRAASVNPVLPPSARGRK
jgi:membrane protein